MSQASLAAQIGVAPEVRVVLAFSERASERVS